MLLYAHVPQDSVSPVRFVRSVKICRIDCEKLNRPKKDKLLFTIDEFLFYLVMLIFECIDNLI